MRNILYISFFLLLSCWTFANDSLRITLLSVGPGSDLYSIYGHTGIRVNNFNTKSDIVYNYGTFDFDEGNFYVKFIRGKLKYSLSVSKYSSFVNYYKRQNRYLYEHTLDINQEDANRLSDLLIENYKPENRKYLYDFFFDNCATKPRDMFNKAIPNLQWPQEEPRFTLRDLLKQYQGGREWYDYGVDLIVGSRADENASVQQEMFLPEYLLEHTGNAFDNMAPLVTDVQLLVKGPFAKKPIRWLSGPFLMCLALFLMQLIFLFLHFRGKRAVWIKIVDKIFTIILGIAGLIIVFMWIGTDHISTKANWNVLWLHPLYFGLLAKSKFAKYLAILSIVLIIIACLAFAMDWQFLHNGNKVLIAAILLFLIRKIHSINTT